MEEEVPDNVDALPVQVFETQEWIGVRKKYILSDIPLHVHFQKGQQLIPNTYLIHFPAVNLPVTEFIVSHSSSCSLLSCCLKAKLGIWGASP